MFERVGIQGFTVLAVACGLFAAFYGNNESEEASVAVAVVVVGIIAVTITKVLGAGWAGATFVGALAASFAAFVMSLRESAHWMVAGVTFIYCGLVMVRLFSTSSYLSDEYIATMLFAIPVAVYVSLVYKTTRWGYECDLSRVRRSRTLVGLALMVLPLFVIGEALMWLNGAAVRIGASVSSSSSSQSVAYIALGLLAGAVANYSSWSANKTWRGPKPRWYWLALSVGITGVTLVVLESIHIACVVLASTSLVVFVKALNMRTKDIVAIRRTWLAMILPAGFGVLVAVTDSILISVVVEYVLLVGVDVIIQRNGGAALSARVQLYES